MGEHIVHNVHSKQLTFTHMFCNKPSLISARGCNVGLTGKPAARGLLLLEHFAEVLMSPLYTFATPAALEGFVILV